MRRRRRLLGLLAVFVLVIFLGSFLSVIGDRGSMRGGIPSDRTGQEPAGGTQGLDERVLLRRSSGGEVDVDVVFLNPSTNPEVRKFPGQLVFLVMMNTHSVSLSSYPMAQMAVLRTSDGAEVRQGFRWESGSDDDHHRWGYLLLPSQGPDGRELITGDTRYMELELDGVGGVKQKFRWEKGYLKP